MIVPWYNIFFLIMIIVISTIVLGKQYDFKPKNKNLVLLCDLFLYFVLGLSFGFLLFSGTITWWSCLCTFLIGALSSFLFAVFLNRETPLYSDGIEYTQETLLGKVGIIKEVYSGSFSHGFDCLGELQDQFSSNIRLLVMADTINEGDIFEITDIKDDKILAKITKGKYE